MILTSNNSVNNHVRSNHTKVKSIQGKEIKILSCNIRGWQSKSESLSNIAKKEKADIICLQETHCSDAKAPQIKGYSTYFRNRTQKCKGGLAILVYDKISKFVTKLESSSEPAEFFSLRLDCFDPCLVIINFYGVIESQYSKQEVLKIQSELFSAYETHVNSGSDVLLVGDFNCHIGQKLGMYQNKVTKTSPGGLNLVNWVENNHLSLLNVKDQKHTHYDASTKSQSSNVLDLAITNNPNSVKDFEVDCQSESTPYRLRSVKGTRSRVFTDHRSLIITLSPVWSKKPITNKVTGWNFSKENGDEAFKVMTDEFSAEFLKAIEETEDIDDLYTWYIGKMHKIKMDAYGKTTSTISRAQKIEDERMWHTRIKEISKCMESLDKRHITDKIWQLRSKTSSKYTDKQFVSVVSPQTGLLTKNRAETFDTLLEYNHQLLRKDKMEKDEDILENDSVKDIIIEIGMSLEEEDEDKELTWEEFSQVLLKVKLSGKGVYRDLIKSGPLFQYAFFGMMQRMYCNEEIPREFNNTTLMKLYKGKGSRNEIKSNRFIHLKDYSAKVFERLVMMKMETRMSRATPSFQIGGQRLSSTTEHLVTLMTFMTKLEKVQGGGLCQFLDIRTCFDSIELRDILAETVKAGIKGKPLRNIAKFTDVNRISIQGDEAGNMREVTNSSGQGSGYAPTGTSLTMAKVINDKIAEIELRLGTKVITEVSGLTLSQLMYVDDLSKCCSNSTESRLMGEAITKALKELKLAAHSEKSCILAFGRKREHFKDTVKNDPTIVQGFSMGFKEGETYLGMQFSELGAGDSITKTLLSRRIKCMTKAIDLKNKLGDIRVQSLGWLVTAITVFRAVIVPTLTYGCGAWVNMTKKQTELVEAIQRQCLTTVLEISPKCSYQTLLHVTNIPPAMGIVKKSKVTFINDLLHVKGKGICMDTLLKESEVDDSKGLINEVREICKEWELPDVTNRYVRPENLKEKIEDRLRREVLIESLQSKSAPLHMIRNKSNQNREYFTMPKDRARLGLAFEVGCLNLKANRRIESMKKFGTTQCVIPACTGSDSLLHIMEECQGYSTPRYKDQGVCEEFIDYLYSVNRERISRFKTSMVNWGS